MDDRTMRDVIHGSMEANGICDIRDVRFSSKGVNVYFKERLVFVPHPISGTTEECMEIGRAAADYLKPSTHPDLNDSVAEIQEEFVPGVDLQLSLKSRRACTFSVWPAKEKIIAWANGYLGRPDELFLLSFCHELGHIVAWQKDKADGHGADWRWRYSQVVSAALDMSLFSDPVEIKTHISSAPQFSITLRKSEL